MIDVRYTTSFQLYPYEKSSDQGQSTPQRHPVIIVGGGPVGMAMALDLGRKGTPVLVLDDHDGVGQGSRAICFARRTLEITDRLGCEQRMLNKGVVWNVGRVFHGEEQVFDFNLSPENRFAQPGFYQFATTLF